MKTHHRIVIITLLLLLTLAVSFAARAQEAPAALSLGMQRTFGYGGFNEIQGNFRISAKGPSDLVRVVYYVDAVVMGEVTQAPFQLDFVTDAYEPGVRSLRAVGYTAAGQELASNVIVTRFLSASEAQRSTVILVVGLMGAVGAVMLLSALLTNWLSRGKKRSPGMAGRSVSYGLVGGTVCSRCRKPFALQWWAPNMVLGKLQRCPHCGKWAIVRRASADELEGAQALLEDDEESRSPHLEPRTAQEQLAADLERSRYVGPDQ